MTERRADGHIRTTEWEEIQYKHGNKIGKYATNEIDIVAQKLAIRHQDAPLEVHDSVRERMRDRDMRGHEDQEDLYDEDREMAAAVLEGDEDEDDIIARFRNARVKAMQEEQSRNRFGKIRHIHGSSYIQEITEASTDAWVVGALIEGDSEASVDFIRAAEVVSSRNPQVKFVSCKSTEAIPNFPKTHLPCVVIYTQRKMLQQVTGLEVWCSGSAKKPTPDSIEASLRRYGVLPKLEGEDDDEDEEASNIAKRGKMMWG